MPQPSNNNIEKNFEAKKYDFPESVFRAPIDFTIHWSKV